MSDTATILFVDDEERVVNLLRMIFRDTYHVLVCTSGQEAIEILRTTRVDVLVSDQRMPGMTGIEVLSTAREVSPTTIRLLLTGYSDLAAIVGSVNDGEVYRFLNKPWDHKAIQKTIADAVSAAQATRDAVLEGNDANARVDPQKPALPKLLLIDDETSDLKAMADLLSEEFNVVMASSIAKALVCLERNDIGVIVTEAFVQGEDVGDFLSVLKQHYPTITTVMLTRHGNADLVIRLINKAQIFRFATKPLRRRSLTMAISAAMKEHMRYRARPLLVLRHQVEASEQPENNQLATSIKKSLRRWYSRIPFFSGSH